MLSRGQKYRALLADLVCQEKPVWLLDEFASDLDPLTATIVASKLRSIAKRIGSIVFVAAANNEHFYAALRPNKVIKFDLGLEPRVMTMTEYKNELF